MTVMQFVEALTGIVAKQNYLIRELFSTVEQLNATTSLAEEVAEANKMVEALLGSPEQ